jgi:hypothetical protein
MLIRMFRKGNTFPVDGMWIGATIREVNMDVSKAIKKQDYHMTQQFFL